MSIENIGNQNQPEVVESEAIKIALERRKQFETIFDSLKESIYVKAFIQSDSMMSPEDYDHILGERDEKGQRDIKKTRAISDLNHWLENHPDVQLFKSLKEILGR